MAFVRPTLNQLRNRAVAIINEKLAEQGVDAALRHSVLNILATVMAEMANEEMAYLDYLALQCTPYTATDEFIDAWGLVWNVKRKLASFSTGKITITGTAGSTLPTGAEWTRADNAVYITTESALIPESGSIDIAVKSEKTGLNTNAAASVKMALRSPVAGINSEALVNDLGLTGGAEIEQDEAYRLRILLRIQNPPAGGSKTDWERWTLEVSGVTRAWCYPLEMGPGTVGVRFMMDNTYSNGIPQAGDIARVQAYLEAYERKPVTATVFVSAPIPHEITITVQDLQPDDAETRAAIDAEMKDLFWREAYPGVKVFVSKIWGAVNIAAGVDSFTLAEPTTNEQLPAGHMPVYNEINYITGEE